MHIFYLDSTEKFIEKLLVEFSTVGFELKKPELGFFVQLSAWLGTLPPKSLVILIDEYDAPLTNCLDNPKLFSEIRSVMSDLFLTLKSREGCQRFFFMTGITKFSNTSIFSAFNNLQDISLDPKFS
ncbi:AAA family ATPase [Parasutterella secunda]|uniref:AAA family ATPase n=1 Tax=Parasutterella secunda TaxID=626947 RepID=A0ABS2GVD0_9BURK|nr:AAA family ATPase [Parasutterella secunda]MBM6929419.1 AAA family ATPase [Parasutterella secunda]